MLITLIRHGESHANAKGQIAGGALVSLTERGTAQARAISEALRFGSYDVLLSSDRHRAIQTARPIASVTRLDTQITSDLREREWGELAQKYPDDYYKQLRASGKSFYEFLPPGGESFLDLECRARSFLKQLLCKYPRKAVLLVAHESINKALLKVMLGLDWGDWASISQRNACINVIGVGSDFRGTATQLDCVDHLSYL